MSKIYIDAKDKYVAARVFYGNSVDSKLYVDPEFETLAGVEEVTDAFIAGVLVVNVGTAFVRPAAIDGTDVDVNGDTYTVEEA